MHTHTSLHPRRFPPRKPLLIASVLSLAALLTPSATRACSVCGCSLSSDWGAQGYAETPGWQTDLRSEYFEQSVLRTGSSTVDRSSLELPNDDEIQQRTLNRNYWLGLDYSGGESWGVTLQIPYHSRFHTTIAPGDTDISTSRVSGLGDLRLVGRYLYRVGNGAVGFQLGLKLPSGKYTQTFSSGPQAGEALDRGLQLGTGTVDGIAGVSYFGRYGDSLGYFAQATAQNALTERRGFKPSPSLTVSTGLRYLNTTRFLPQLQLNARWEGREAGPESDRDNSGSFVAYVSPGLSVEVTPKIDAYGFLQLPVIQHASGLQLQPRWLLSAGVRFRL